MVGPAARTASAPGRVTIIGEHTDYNGGLSLGVATMERTTASVVPTDDGRVEVRSDALGTASVALHEGDGPGFVLLAAALVAAAGLRGARISVASTLPVGAGLSSSAAYAVALALASGIDGDEVAIARSCQAAERAAGSDVGLLDQLVVLCARPGEVVDLDFSGPQVATFPLSARVGLSVVDTGVRRELASSGYAARRAECDRAAALLGPLGQLDEPAVDQLADPALRRRARHVASECRRVRAARAALRDGDLEVVGSLLDEGHASLRDDFEVSTDEVERCRDVVRRLPGVAGARLTGAGFGGALVVAHDPGVAVALEGRFCSRLGGGAGALLSPTTS